MKLVLETNGVDVDAWIREFAQTTVRFAIWHHELGVEDVTVRLDRELDHDGSAYTRCSLRAATARGVVAAGATARDVCDAILDASNLLEVAMHRPGAPEPVERRLAA